MPNEPKLSVFTLQLRADSNPSFYKRFVSTASDVSESEASVFLNFMQEFFHKGDQQKFHKNKNKAFTLVPEDTEDGVKAIRHHPEKFVLEGTIIGGRHGDEYTKSKLEDKTQREQLAKNDVLTRKIYFFLHVPLDENIGVLMIQSYSNESVTTLFADFVKKFFAKEARGYKEATIKKYVPQSYIDDFQKHAKVKSFTFETRMLLGHLAAETIGEKEEKFKVTVKIESEDGISKRRYDKWKNTLQRSKIGLGSNSTTFENFARGKAAIENQNKKKSTFELQRDFDIQPVIYLEEPEIKWKTDRELDFSTVKNYCFKILNEIEKDVYKR